ncbi:MAG: hypothetical protein AVDCRST_MAG95-1095, partial [uncultured Adhaeribacter sp.]
LNSILSYKVQALLHDYQRTSLSS